MYCNHFERFFYAVMIYIRGLKSHSNIIIKTYEKIFLTKCTYGMLAIAAISSIVSRPQAPFLGSPG